MKIGNRSNEDVDNNYIRLIDEEVRHVFDEVDFYITSHRSSHSTTSSAEAVRRLKAVRSEGWPQETQSTIKPSDSVSTSSGGSSLIRRQLAAEKERRDILDETVSQLQESIRRIKSNLAVVIDSRTAPLPHVMQQRATSTGPTLPITSGARDRVIDSSRWSVTEPRLPTADNRSSSIFRLQRIDMEPFNGDPKKWKDWQSMFRDAVHNNATLTTTEKMAALRQKHQR